MKSIGGKDHVQKASQLTMVFACEAQATNGEHRFACGTRYGLVGGMRSKPQHVLWLELEPIVRPRLHAVDSDHIGLRLRFSRDVYAEPKRRHVPDWMARCVGEQGCGSFTSYQDDDFAYSLVVGWPCKVAEICVRALGFVWDYEGDEVDRLRITNIDDRCDGVMIRPQPKRKSKRKTNTDLDPEDVDFSAALLSPRTAAPHAPMGSSSSTMGMIEDVDDPGIVVEAVLAEDMYHPGAEEMIIDDGDVSFDDDTTEALKVLGPDFSEEFDSILHEAEDEELKDMCAGAAFETSAAASDLIAAASSSTSPPAAASSESLADGLGSGLALAPLRSTDGPARVTQVIDLYARLEPPLGYADKARSFCFLGDGVAEEQIALGRIDSVRGEYLKAECKVHKGKKKCAMWMKSNRRFKDCERVLKIWLARAHIVPELAAKSEEAFNSHVVEAGLVRRRLEERWKEEDAVALAAAAAGAAAS